MSEALERYTKSEPSTGQIHERLAAIMLEVDHIGKDRKSSGGGSFNFRGIEDVMNSLHAIFKKHGVFIVTEIINHESKAIESARGTAGYHHLSRVAFHLTASDGSRCTILSLGEAMDYGDKGATKTLSIALKYALLNLFLIPTKETAAEDPDAEVHEIAKPASKPAEPAKPKASPQAIMAQRIEADKDAKWFEVEPFAKGPHKGKTLGDVAAEGDVVAIKQVLDYIDPVALEHELAVKRLKAALAEAESYRRASDVDAKGKVETRTDPETGKSASCPF